MPNEFDYQDPQQPAAQPPKPQNDQISLEDFEEMARQKYGVPKNLVKAMVGQESGGQPNNGWGATSPTGVKGKYQVTEATAKQYGLDRNDPFQQTVAAMKHLRTQYDALGNIKDDNARWLSAVGRYYGGNDAVAPDGRISTASPDGVSNPLKHMERVANNWKALGLDGGQGGSDFAPQPAPQPQPAPKRQAPAPNVPIPNLIKQVAGPNATQSLISGALADTKAQSDAINAQMKQPINIGGMPQASGVIPKGAINIQQPTGPLPSRQQAQDVQADQQARQIIAQRQARRRPVPVAAQQPASATLDPNKSYTGNAGVDELIQHGVSTFNRGVQGGVGMLATPLEGLALAQDASQQRILDQSAPDFANWRGEQAPMVYSGIKELTEPVKQATANMFPTLAPDKIDNFWENVLPSTLGGQAAFMVMNHIAKGGPLTGAMLGSLMGISQGYEDAIASGADQQTALKAATLNAAPGALQAFGLGRNLAGAGGARSVLGRVANIAEQGGVMAGQRAGLNTIANNVVGYDPNRPTGEGVPEAFGLGALGGALPEIGGALLARRRGAAPPVTPDQAEAPTGVPPSVAPETQPVIAQPPAVATGKPKGRFAAKVDARLGAQSPVVAQTVTPEAPVAKPAAKPASSVEVLAPDAPMEAPAGTRLRKLTIDGNEVIVRTPKGMDRETAQILTERQLRQTGVENAPQPESGTVEAQPGITERDATTQAKATGEVPLPEAATESLPVRPAERPIEPARGVGMETAPVKGSPAEAVKQAPLETPKVVESPVATEPTTEAQSRPSDVYRRNGIDITDEAAGHVDRRHAAREAEDKGTLGKLGEFARKALFLTGKDAPERAFAEHPALRKILGLPEIPKELYESAPKDWAHMAQHTMDALAESAGAPRSSRIDEGSLDKVEDFLAGKIDHRNPEHRNLAEVYGQTRAAVDISHGRVDDLFADPTVKEAIQKAQAHLDSGKALRGTVRTELVKTLEAAQDRINKGQPGIQGQSDADVTGLKPNAIKDFITDLSTGRLSGDPKGWLGKQFRDVHAKSYSGETREPVYTPTSEQGRRNAARNEASTRPAQPDTTARESAEPVETAKANSDQERQDNVDFAKLAAGQRKKSSDSLDLLTAIRREGGMSQSEQMSGEVRRLSNKETGTSGLVNKKSKVTPDEMRTRMVSEGLSTAETVDEFLQEVEGKLRAQQTRGKMSESDLDAEFQEHSKKGRIPLSEEVIQALDDGIERDQKFADAFEKVSSYDKEPTRSEINEFKRLARKQGIKPAEADVLVKEWALGRNGASESGGVEAQESSAISAGSKATGETKVPGNVTEGEGFTTSAFGVGALRKFNDAQLSTIASHFKAHADNFVAWGKAMIADFGQSIRPKLREIWDQGQKFFKSELGSAKVSPGGPPIEDSVPKKAAKEKIPLPKGLNIRQFADAADHIISQNKLSESTQAKADKAFDGMLNAVDANDGAAFVKAQLELKHALTNKRWGAADIARPINAGGELSVIGRQGFLGWVSNPVISYKALMNVRSSEAGMHEWLAKVHADPDFDLIKKSGVDVGLFNELDLSKGALSREENTSGNWVEALSHKSNVWGVPLLAKGITTLERINKTFIDGQRYGLMKHGLDIIRSDSANGHMLDEGGKPSQQLKAWANRVNIITGRGNLGDSAKVKAAADLLSTVFYSPRFSVSRFQAMLPNDAIRSMELSFKRGEFTDSFKNRPKISNQMWADYAKQSVGQIAASTGIAIALTQFAGGKVSLDPDDPDFMKVVLGNVHIPLLQGGQQPAARFAFRMAKRAYEMGKAGAEGNGEKVADTAEKAISQTGSFLRQKEAPLFGVAHDQLAARKNFTDPVTGEVTRMGTNAIGQPMMAGKDLLTRFLPMMYQQAVDTYREAGMGVAIPSAIAEGGGLSVGVYDSGKYGNDAVEGSKNRAQIRPDYSYAKDKWYDPRAGMEPDSKFRPRVQRANALYTAHLQELRDSDYYKEATPEIKAKMEDSLRTRVREASYDEQPNEGKLSPGALIGSERAGEKRKSTNLRKRANRSW